MLKLLSNNFNKIIITNINNIKQSNEYIYEFTEKKNINNLNLINVNLPKNENYNITNNNNQLFIVYNNDNRIIELEPNYYNRYDILEYINYIFDEEKINIKCSLNSEDKFIFESNNIFEIHNIENSILPILGFYKTGYINKYIYIGDKINLNDNIFYLSIYNLNTEPIFKINNDTNEIIKLNSNIHGDVDYFLIKFFISPNNIINNKCEFFFNYHELTFNII